MDAHDGKPPKTPEEDWIVFTLCNATGVRNERIIEQYRKLAKAYREGRISAETAIASAKIVAIKGADHPMPIQHENKTMHFSGPGTEEYRREYERIFAKTPSYPTQCVGCGTPVGEKDDHWALGEAARCKSCGPFADAKILEGEGPTE